MFSLVAHGALIWLLITLFSRSTNSSQTLRETWVVVIGMSAVRLVTFLLFGGFLGLLTFVIDVVVLYFLVDKVCELNRRATVKICVWYVIVVFLIGVVTNILSIPVDAS